MAQRHVSATYVYALGRRGSSSGSSRGNVADAGELTYARDPYSDYIGEWGWPNGHGVDAHRAATMFHALANSGADAMFFFQ